MKSEREAMVETFGEKESIANAVLSLCQRVESLIAARKATLSNERILIAMAGVPGSGKSTISAAVLKTLHQRGFKDAVVLPMVSSRRPLLISATSQPFFFLFEPFCALTCVHLQIGRISLLAIGPGFLRRSCHGVSQTRCPLHI